MLRNSQKSFGEKAMEYFSNRIWTRNCLTAPCELEQCRGGESSCWAKVRVFFYAQLHVSASLFPLNKFG